MWRITGWCSGTRRGFGDGYVRGAARLNSGANPTPSAAHVACATRKTRRSCVLLTRKKVMTNTTAERQVPLLELESQHREIREKVLPEVMRVIDSQKFI